MSYKTTILIGGKLPAKHAADFLYYLQECKADEILFCEDGKTVVLRIESAREPGGVMLLEDFLEGAGMSFDSYHHEDEESFEDCSPEHTQNWLYLRRPEPGVSYTTHLTWQFGEPAISVSDIEAIAGSAKSVKEALDQIREKVCLKDAGDLPAFETETPLEELRPSIDKIQDRAVKNFLQQRKPDAQLIPVPLGNHGALEFAI